MHPPALPYIWAVLAAAILVAIWLGMRTEGRWFAARGKGSSWRTLRICTIPIAIATAGLLLMVSRAVTGPEALLVFYLGIFTAAPVFYFAMHWIAGLWLRPRLTTGEVGWIGFTGLVVAIGPAAFASAAHPWVFMVARSFG